MTPLRLRDQQGAVEDARLAAQALFQGGEVEAIAVQFDLAIAAADEAQPTLLVVASAVAGTVGTQQAAAIGQLDEAGAGARRIVPITLRQAGAEGDDLPGPVGLGDLLSVLVEQEHRGAGDGLADGDVVFLEVVVGDDMAAGEGGVLRRSVAIHQVQSRMPQQRPAHVRHREDVAAGEQLAKAAEAVRVEVHQGVEQRGGEPGAVGSALVDQPAQHARVEGAEVVQHAAAAVEQRAPDLQGRRIEGQRRVHQEAHLRSEREERLAQAQTGNAGVGAGDGFRAAGGARGEVDVGDLVRREAWPGDRGWSGRQVPDRDAGKTVGGRRRGRAVEDQAAVDLPAQLCIPGRRLFQVYI
ncbi:hypothetical protein P4200_18690 [Pseudomonas aeruginosa]|nr:hypothetical protein [Pseudomonas aeruginosa]